nr:MAG TPA: DNA-packaging protein [Bacteriophage sp.]
MKSNKNIQTIASVEDMPAIAADIVTNYCIDNDIDEKDIYPSIWADIITELYNTLFFPNRNLLKLNKNLDVNCKSSVYDFDNVVYVYNNIYKRLCNKHCQEVTQKGFCDMIGIDPQTLYNWSNSNCSSSARFDLHQKIMQDNEESLFNLMKDRRNNPMKYLPKLNKVHSWNMPGVRDANTRKAIDYANIPKLNENTTQLEYSPPLQLSENDTQFNE